MTIQCVCILYSCATLATAQVWGTEPPRLRWQEHELNLEEARTLLRHVCPSGTKQQEIGKEVSFSCVAPVVEGRSGEAVPQKLVDSRSVASAQNGATAKDIEFQWVRGVRYGHFLSPSSDDAALSGWDGEGHPDFFGGTLLLTKENGAWHPVWYKSGVISRYCRNFPLGSGRQILICEEHDGGMGHSYDIVYFLDFTSPTDPMRGSLLVADSYLLMCRDQQRQSIGAIQFRVTERPARISVLVSSGRRRLSESEINACGDNAEVRAPAERKYQVDFVLTGERLRATAQSRQTLELFLLH
jgi:hypothetical protein